VFTVARHWITMWTVASVAKAWFCTIGGMTNQRGLRIIYPSGDVYATNLVMHWPVTETRPATKQPPETLQSTNYEVLQFYSFLPFPCSDALVCIYVDPRTGKPSDARCVTASARPLFWHWRPPCGQMEHQTTFRCL